MTQEAAFNWDDVPAGGAFIKWTQLGQEEEGDVAEVKEGTFGFEVHFTDGRILGLSLKDLREKVKDAAPGIGDHLWCKWVSERNVGQPDPKKIFDVRVTRRGSAPDVDDLA
jgi:hypothetical protein